MRRQKELEAACGGKKYEMKGEATQEVHVR
jgi:hypothetical protein